MLCVCWQEVSFASSLQDVKDNNNVVTKAEMYTRTFKDERNKQQECSSLLTKNAEIDIFPLNFLYRFNEKKRLK